MAGSVNKVILIGNVGRDPEERTMQNGNKVVNLTIATSESWNDKASGEKKERTEWHRVVCFNERVGDVIMKYVKKGSKLYVEGTLQTRKWQDRDGTDKFTTEVVIERFRGEVTMLGDPKAGGGRSDDGYGDAGGRSFSRGNRTGGSEAGWSGGDGMSGRAAATSGSGVGYRSGGDLDDEIPF